MDRIIYKMLEWERERERVCMCVCDFVMDFKETVSGLNETLLLVVFSDIVLANPQVYLSIPVWVAWT